MTNFASLSLPKESTFNYGLKIDTLSPLRGRILELGRLLKAINLYIKERSRRAIGLTKYSYILYLRIILFGLLPLDLKIIGTLLNPYPLLRESLGRNIKKRPIENISR
ncbi:hypothetical protein N7449_004959 [Penicillium cf. viridicatum]|uniref:Uncharacterized protein n=1 Tax=Penicillium cf. viridicatum TaxID=2972119 RepID=A0A9W9SYV7_9EURO|nr:hypothetical protein N7449_004959 [Penicillium cf. viridicatum]